MAEVVNVPKLGPSQTTLTREKSSLDNSQAIEKKKIEPIHLKGTIIEKQPSFISKLKDTFIAEDARDVGDYILWDILVPTIKRTIRDIIVGSTDRIFLGTNSYSNSNNLYRDKGVTYVRRTDYASQSVVKSRSNTSEPRQITQRSNVSGVNFKLNEIVFDNYEDATAVLERLIDYLDTYGQVSVDDYLDLVGRTNPYTSQNWGWTSLSSATIVTTFGGYMIKLPNPVVIKKD